jgi:glycosyltransferase involved in cell wall biosynthesis
MVLRKNQANFDASDTPTFLDDLLVLNYVMDPTHPALAHQVEVVEKLALKFSLVTVLTGKSDWAPTAPNIRVFTSDWQPGHNIGNVYRFYRVFFQLIRKYKFVAVFSHMTSVQSCLAGPILKLRKIKHLLWYAHAQNSTILRIAYFWVTTLVTSTAGSCPLTGEKVLYLGQSIDQNKFEARRIARLPFRRFVHIGRTDPSKNLNLIVETVFRFRKFDEGICLEFVGNPSGPQQKVELEKLMRIWADAIDQGWLVFSPAVPRVEIPNLLNQYDIFIHAFKGSLDKTLIEATMTRMPVITINQEYINEFGSWGEYPVSLESELAGILNSHQTEVDIKLSKRIDIAIDKHSSKNWIAKLEASLRSK